jgi:hypothetical protein
VVSLGLCKTDMLCFLYDLTLFYKLSNVIFTAVYFRELFFNNFLFVYAYINFTNSLHEGSVSFSVPFYTVTTLRKPRQSWDQPGHFRSTFEFSRPTENGQRCPINIYFNSLLSDSKLYTAFSLICK